MLSPFLVHFDVPNRVLSYRMIVSVSGHILMDTDTLPILPERTDWLEKFSATQSQSKQVLSESRQRENLSE